MKICILTVALAAASFGQLRPLGAPSPSSSSPAAAAPAAAITPDTVVATVAGISVTAGDVMKLMRYPPQSLQQLFQQNPQQGLGAAYQMKWLTSEAEKGHLDQDPDTKERLEALIEWQKEDILARAMLNQVDNGYAVKQDQIDEFYKKNQSRWEEAKIKIILIAFKPAPLPGTIKPDESPDDKVKRAAQEALAGVSPLSGRTRDQAHQLAADLVKQLREGADFGKLVEKYSDDSESKGSGGDFGTPIKANSSFAQDLKKAVLAMQKDEISDPVEQGYGFYVIKLVDKSVQPLDPALTAEIGREIRNNHMADYFADLTKRFTPQVVRPDFFIQVQKSLTPPPPAK